MFSTSEVLIWNVLKKKTTSAFLFAFNLLEIKALKVCVCRGGGGGCTVVIFLEKEVKGKVYFYIQNLVVLGYNIFSQAHLLLSKL
jgi:hypothetical protein